LEFQLYLYPFRYIFYADYQKDFWVWPMAKETKGCNGKG
jgi:hypothetical protein